jgi:RNA polymerase sigma-70 factor (ECF subfamily)
MGDAGPAAVERAGAGDELAFAELVEAYHHDMLRVAYVVLADASLAEDAAQAAWINAWRNLKQLRDPNKVRAWLLAITTNEARQLSRRQRRSHDEMESVASASIADPALLDLARALARLSNNERRLLSLKFVGGLSSDEIGVALGVSANAVRHRLMRLLYCREWLP